MISAGACCWAGMRRWVRDTFVIVRRSNVDLLVDGSGGDRVYCTNHDRSENCIILEWTYIHRDRNSQRIPAGYPIAHHPYVRAFHGPEGWTVFYVYEQNLGPPYKYFSWTDNWRSHVYNAEVLASGPALLLRTTSQILLAILRRPRIA